MVISVPYQNLTHTLKCIKLQVKDSLPYISEFVPSDIETPKELFNFLKPLLTFKHDPHNVEYIQTVQTLLGVNNGYGDCDCFSVLALTSMHYLGFSPIYVALTGNSSSNPTHIYTEVYDSDKGKITAFDLTNPIYNMQRKYKYKQRLLFQL